MPIRIGSIAAVFVIAMLSLGSCKPIKALRYMNKKHPSIYTLKTPGKTVKMIPIVHIGMKQFYNELHDKVVDYKKQGYVVYYEQVQTKRAILGITVEQYDTMRRKYRKIKGGQGNTRKDYEKLTDMAAFKNKRVQPEYSELGISQTDVNADVKFPELITEYERLYGKVILDSCDIHTPIDSAYSCQRLHNKMKPVQVDYRNRQLAGMIKSSVHNKILVLYGAGHKKGLKKLLRK